MDEEDSSSDDFPESPKSKVMKSYKNQSPLSEPKLDRISELPETLLIRILSLLNTTRAVRTCVLSKKWENLWKRVDSFKVSYGAGVDDVDDKVKFVSFVNRTLMRCDLPKIKRFSLIVRPNCFEHVISDRWLQFAFEKDVEFLKLDIPYFEFSAAGWYHKNLQLVELKIRSGIFHLGRRALRWTCLKKLTLKDLGINGKMMARILKGCPVLETLRLIRVSGLKHLNIISRSVKKLEVRLCDTHDLLDINATWLLELNISKDIYGVKPSLINLSSLIRANITMSPILFDLDVDRMLLEANYNILQSVHHAKELTLGPFFIKALSYSKLIQKPSPLFDCKYIAIRFPISKYDLPGIANLLQSSSNLEKLVIVVKTHYQIKSPYQYDFWGHLPGICDFDGDNYLSTQIGYFPCLKNVEVAHCPKLCLGDEVQSSNKLCYDFEFIEHILRNACVLEKLVIKARKEKCSKCSKNCSLHHFTRLCDKLSNLKWDGCEAKEFELKTNQSDFEIRIRDSGSKSS